ncbi:MAG TPA: hypothetical protein VFT95_03090 [Micromonosporaceae bacterium]|nr:hypothetical protein [Micromonosporaceae bacterium]
MLVVACDHSVSAYAGKARADQLAAALPAKSWQPISAGPGAKGPRIYQWAWINLAEASSEHQWLLIRRNPTRGELAYYRCWSPQPATLRELVRVAGIRWTVEECFQAGKDQIGMDHYQVRGWTPWHRFITLAMLALALLVAIAATHPPTSDTLIALTVAEPAA